MSAAALPLRSAPAAPEEGRILQHVLFAAPDLCAEAALFWRAEAPEAEAGAAARGEALALALAPGARVRFDTCFNALSLGKWRGLARLDGLALELVGRGRARLRVIHHGADAAATPRPEGAPDAADGPPPLPPGEVLAQVEIDLSAGPVRLDLGPCTEGLARPGTIGFALDALPGAGGGAGGGGDGNGDGGVLLESARYTTGAAPAPPLRLAICITTFRREAQVAATVARLSRWLEDCPEAAAVHVFVTDNGRSADLPPSPRVTVIPNPNLGGAGGFARGMIAAREGGFSHVLFMDDDAACAPESIRRTLAFLALARDPAAAVAGAMIPTATPWRLWEAGARFDRRCLPQHHGADLRDPGAVAAIEAATMAPPPRDLYGGWWFFAFPLAAARHLPFPFFVRGDDVSFCLANHFRIVTLNGVASFQDGFLDKESPLVWYLDLRSHLVHHLALPHMAVGRLALMRMAAWFFLRNLVRFQYESMEAVLMALRDVTEGPEVFAGAPDAAAPRAELAALLRDEIWREGTPPPERIRYDARSGWRRHLFRLSLNGHLLPFFARRGNRIVLEADRRSDYGAMWGAAEITFRDRDGTRVYTTRVSARRMLGLAARLGWTGLRFLRAYPRLVAEYRAAYPRLTGAAFWRARLGLPEA